MSPKEREVYEYFVKTGASNAQISAALQISEDMAKLHVWHVMRELGYGSRCEMLAGALWAKIHGLEAELRDAKKQRSEALAS